jgi:hypothetical protein
MLPLRDDEVGKSAFCRVPDPMPKRRGAASPGLFTFSLRHITVFDFPFY